MLLARSTHGLDPQVKRTLFMPSATQSVPLSERTPEDVQKKTFCCLKKIELVTFHRGFTMTGTGYLVAAVRQPIVSPLFCITSVLCLHGHFAPNLPSRRSKCVTFKLMCHFGLGIPWAFCPTMEACGHFATALSLAGASKDCSAW